MDITTHKVTIKNQRDGSFLTFGNCEIFIDDKPIHGVKGFKFSMEVGEVPLFKLEFYPGEIEIEGVSGDMIAIGDFMKDLLAM